jgi:hypothetical protein
MTLQKIVNFAQQEGFNTDGRPPSSKNRDLANFRANVITQTRLTLYHRNSHL